MVNCNTFLVLLTRLSIITCIIQSCTQVQTCSTQIQHVVNTSIKNLTSLNGVTYSKLMEKGRYREYTVIVLLFVGKETGLEEC